jgi:HMG (high mobility group) box
MVPKLKKEQEITHREAMSKAGEIWHAMSADEKLPYDKMHQDDQKR